MKIRTHILALVLCSLCMLAWLAGCTAEDQAAYLANRAHVEQTIAATTQQVATLDREAKARELELATLRRAAEAAKEGAEKTRLLDAVAGLEKQQRATAEAIEANRKLAEQLGSALKATDGIAAAARGDVAGIGAAVAGIPGLGPYGPLVALGVTLVGGVVNHLRQRGQIRAANAHLANVVQSVEMVGADWSDADKAAARTIQGPETTAVVHAVKAKLDL